MQDENISIIEEAAALRFVLRKRGLEKVERRQLDVDAVLSHILADIQEQQDHELSAAVANLSRMVSSTYCVLVMVMVRDA